MYSVTETTAVPDGAEQAKAFSFGPLASQGYLSYIKTLPLNDMPEIFGLHDNANITFAQNETFALFSAILQLQPKSSSVSSQGQEEVGSRRTGSRSVQSQAAPFCLHL